MTLLDRLLADDTLALAWARVRSNGGGAGADGVTVEEFAGDALTRIARLRDQLRDGRYSPTPLLRIELPRPGREPRLLAVPPVRDRVLQSAAALVLTPLLDPQFEDESFAYRPGRSVRDAIERVVAARDEGFDHVVDADIHLFFDEIPHDALVQRLAALLPDGSLLPLVRQWLATPVQTASGCHRPLRGIAQGSPLSPLLANLYLDGFDEAITAVAGRRLVRYADDFLILCRDMESAEHALEDAALWLAGAGLELNFEKTRIATFAQGIGFLGVRFDGGSQWAEDPAAEIWLLPPRLRPDAKPQRMPQGVQTKPRPSPFPVVHPESPASPPAGTSLPRRVGHDDAPSPLLRTLYLTEPGAYLRLEGGRVLAMKDGEELLSVPLEKIDQVLAADEGAVSFAVLRALLGRGARLAIQDGAGEILGACLPLADGRVELRRLQHRRCGDPAFSLAVARSIVAGKIANGRLLLRRHYRFRPGGESPVDDRLREAQAHALRVGGLEELRGVEGAAARGHFEGFAGLLPPGWTFPGRRRQPPTDPVNALLSYGYRVLFHNLLTLVVERGLDPHLGCLHAVRDGHPALVLDLMEEFRTLAVDAVVLNLLARGNAGPGDFTGGHDQPCRIGLALRKAYLAALEGKLQSRIAHPAGGTDGDYRRAMRTQVAHWIQVLEGGAAVYRPFMPR